MEHATELKIALQVIKNLSSTERPIFFLNTNEATEKIIARSAFHSSSRYV
jgi:hypothetical protein